MKFLQFFLFFYNHFYIQKDSHQGCLKYTFLFCHLLNKFPLAAEIASIVRLASFVFERRFFTCQFIVFSVAPNFSAICLLLRPFTISLSIRTSVFVKSLLLAEPIRTFGAASQANSLLRHPYTTGCPLRRLLPF